MNNFIQQLLKPSQIEEINAYLKQNKQKIFTKPQLSQMTKKDELGILTLDIVIRGNWFSYDVDGNNMIEIRYDAETLKDVDDSPIKYVIALNSAISGFRGLALNAQKKPLFIVECEYN